MSNYITHQPQMHGPLEDAIADKLNEAIFGSSKGGVLDPQSPAALAKAEFYSNVLAKTGSKFVTSKEGAATVDKAIDKASTSLIIYGLVPGVLVGLGIGWFLFRRKA